MAIHPIYTTRGDHVAYFMNGYLHNLSGEYIGFVDIQAGLVYSVLGEYVGYFSKDGRILRKRALADYVPRRTPPPPPPRLVPPSSVPLAPMMSDLSFDVIEVLEDMPDRLHTMDGGELKDDMD